MTTTLRKEGRLGCVRAGASSAAVIGTLVFALVNFLLAVIPTLYAVTILIYIWSSPSPDGTWLPTFGSSPDSPIDLDFAAAQALLLLLMSLISFPFATYLVIGVIKQKPNDIKVYLLYGTIVHVVSSLAVVGFFFLYNTVDMFVCTGVVLLAIYAMILLMINNTYKKFKSLNDQYDHKVLDDTPHHV